MRSGLIRREVSIVVTEYPSRSYLVPEPVTSIAHLGLIEDPVNENSPYLLEVPEQIGNRAAGWLIKEQHDDGRVMLERLTHPGKGDPRFITAGQIAQEDNHFIGRYIRAIFSR
jgi:hypothetical protein